MVCRLLKCRLRQSTIFVGPAHETHSSHLRKASSIVGFPSTYLQQAVIVAAIGFIVCVFILVGAAGPFECCSRAESCWPARLAPKLIVQCVLSADAGKGVD